MRHTKLNINEYLNCLPNLSLMYYKYTPDFINSPLKDPKLDFLLKFSHQKINQALINNRIHIIEKLTTNAVKMRNTSRFMCGTGYSGTVEWGLNFDWTSGAPCLPGSSFKGALLSYLEFAKGEVVQKWDSEPVGLTNGTSWDKNDVYNVFGPQAQDDDPDIGGVIFFDVYPSHFNGFDVDVITPHYGKYYRSSPENPEPPSDTENPIPIPFLAVRAGATFNFAFKVRDSAKVNPDLCDKLKKLIVETGQNFGFGAKTSSGYGYFEKVPGE